MHVPYMSHGLNKLFSLALISLSIFFLLLFSSSVVFAGDVLLSSLLRYFKKLQWAPGETRKNKDERMGDEKWASFASKYTGN